ncbi:aminoacyl-tRNA hydrolase [Vibrio splendidus]
MARQDLEMNPGKLAAQIGHAFHYAVRNKELDPSILDAYENPDIGGSKVCLWAKNEFNLHQIRHKLTELGIPTSLVIDQNHVCPPHFDGNPIVTALGVGPCTKSQAKRALSKLKLIN